MQTHEVPGESSMKAVIPSRGAVAVVPKRPFGDTGISFSKLCLGGFSVMGTDSRFLLDEALRYGIDCWEFTSFTGRAFGDYFKTHPGIRERVFLSGKTKSTAPAVMQEELDRALAENETSVIDFFAVHGVDDVEVLTDDVRRWAEKAKKEGKIRFFGFCTHKRVESCLDGAAELGWIDGIQAFTTTGCRLWDARKPLCESVMRRASGYSPSSRWDYVSGRNPRSRGFRFRRTIF